MTKIAENIFWTYELIIREKKKKNPQNVHIKTLNNLFHEFFSNYFYEDLI